MLEVVQVDEQHGQVALARAGQGVLDPLGEQGPVGQAGQRVVERLVDELGLQLLAVGDVAGVEHQAADVGVLQQVGGDRLRVQPGAVAVAHAPGLAAVTPGRRAASATNLATRSRSSGWTRLSGSPSTSSAGS